MSLHDDFKAAGEQYAAQIREHRQAAQQERQHRQDVTQHGADTLAALLAAAEEQHLINTQPDTDHPQGDDLATNLAAFINAQESN